MISRWCAGEAQEFTRMEPDGTWETFTPDPHDLCVAQCWHDRWHAENRCCGDDDEREAWACTCECHQGQGNGRYRRGRPEPEFPVHDYVSTACIHDVHGQCRVTCKFCPSRCRCACHAGRGGK